jgi:hypothetical protein
VNKDDGSGKAARLAEFLGVPVLASLPVIPQRELVSDAYAHPLVAAAVEAVIDAIDNKPAHFPNRVDFHEFMCALSGNAATMDGTAVSADELWSLPDVEPLLKNIPNGGAFDRRYIEAEADAEKLLVPTVVSAGGFAVPSADW